MESGALHTRGWETRFSFSLDRWSWLHMSLVARGDMGSYHKVNRHTLDE